jgi:hypothetical protein
MIYHKWPGRRPVLRQVYSYICVGNGQNKPTAFGTSARGKVCGKQVEMGCGGRSCSLSLNGAAMISHRSSTSRVFPLLLLLPLPLPLPLPHPLFPRTSDFALALFASLRPPTSSAAHRGRVTRWRTGSQSPSAATADVVRLCNLLFNLFSSAGNIERP